MRKTSEGPDYGVRFPWKDPTVCFIEQDNETGQITPVGNTALHREAMTERAVEGKVRLFAVWPGKMRSDLFEVDDLSHLMRIHGIEDRPQESEVEVPEPVISVTRCNAESSPMSKGRLCTFHTGHEGPHSWMGRL